MTERATAFGVFRAYFRLEDESTIRVRTVVSVRMDAETYVEE